LAAATGQDVQEALVNDFGSTTQVKGIKFKSLNEIPSSNDSGL
jgi:hypothetical protein